MARHEPSALLGGVRFESVPQDRNRAYVVTTWSGIDEGVQVRREQVARPGAHGAFSLPGHLDARVVTMAGHVLAPSPEMLLHMVRRLTGLLADGGTESLSVLGEREVHLKVGLAAQTAVTVRGNDPRVADFQLQLWAPDPRMYGEAHEFVSGQTAYHRGNFPATPVIELAGAASGNTITGPAGKAFTITQSRAAGQTHRIDLATGRVYLNGVLQLGVVSRGDLWTVPPGLPGVVHTLTGSGTMKVILPDTFV